MLLHGSLEGQGCKEVQEAQSQGLVKVGRSPISAHCFEHRGKESRVENQPQGISPTKQGYHGHQEVPEVPDALLTEKLVVQLFPWKKRLGILCDIGYEPLPRRDRDISQNLKAGAECLNLCKQDTISFVSPRSECMFRSPRLSPSAARKASLS